eukprot:CAMPEP_0170530124 /NCGR_PEP_ID=MMETSP0209-20121228/41386_1 /TAXON_ID=665100 ORGANISM="Litonotus pictus, Strain P1" /NCGR_SAMPLE_ID=MMETSP0209 /ASSEMBLY_ACC=CAM_ASM_000301 /LENGTH=142 /DNA_ID=CAMNT_0010822871 /DNA_START=1 /DNA_END=426 /DNA_ORIENTATION=-
MTGLDAAGKTTALYHLGGGNNIQSVIPTIGFNVETLVSNGFSFTVWDVGGADKTRPLWRHFYQNTDGVIFVIDSSDRDRIEQATWELKKMLNEEELKNCCLLVLANKQDLENAIRPDEMAERMSLSQVKDRQWKIQGTSATT